MTRKVRIFLVGALACLCPAIVGVAWAGETLSAHVTFSPDRLGAATNLSATALFHATTGIPTPIDKVTAYLPAGLEIDTRGAGTCTVAKLEETGPEACPANSRLGFGGGMGLLELAREIIHEPFTLDFFLGPKEGGHLVILAYVNASSPASYQVVVVAREVRAPKPYGIGFTFDIPPIYTLPGASNASVESSFFTVGDSKVAYFKRTHGRNRLAHVRGIVVPKRCPGGGFPYKALVSFADGTSLTYGGAIPCPGK
jgi:hypothetical protein